MASLELRRTKFIQVHEKATKENRDKNEDAGDAYSKCYHEIDAIFTELEDFFCQSKEKFLQQIRSQLSHKPTQANM
jgi:hypothetical protein